MIMKNGLPPKQGLYDPLYEKDACGIGFVVNVKGKRSNKIVGQALTILKNLTHRGGSGSEPNTGDGAGILIQIPHTFLKNELLLSGIDLPEYGYYGVGMVFLPPDANERDKCEKKMEEIIKSEGQTLLGWRTVPIDDSSLGSTAKACMPFIRQVFIGKSPDLKDDLAFERKLYVIRKLAEKNIRYAEKDNNEFFYIASLSCRTIVYKGMLTAHQVGEFYKDLSNDSVDTAMALVHSRYSTNTFPSWERAHPNRYIMHNGEINTLRGNVNWMHARQSVIKTDKFGDDISKIFPIINEDGSDSAIFDNCLEFLTLSGRSIPHAVMMMIPEPWSKNESMDDKKKAFYEYHSCLIEPWDGPAAISFTDGKMVGAVLDRNGLRPARYYITKDDMVILSSEVGVLEIPPENILAKERLHPGRMLLIDMEAGKIINDAELKEKIVSEKPYREWLDKYIVTLDKGGEGLRKAMDALFEEADKAFSEGANILILSDRGLDRNYAPIPALLAVSGLHHHLIRQETRTQLSIVIESGEPREVHHIALLLGYGASAINPYLAFETIDDMIHQGMIENLDHKAAIKNYIKSLTKGVVKVLSKMGISTIQSYQGAQIFESIGIKKEVIDKYFTWTPSRIEGIGLDEIAKEAVLRHMAAFSERAVDDDVLESEGQYQWRKNGEYHMYNPETIYALQKACRTGDYSTFKEYSKLLNDQSQKLCTLRGLMNFKFSNNPIPIEEVESVESICRRFKTGAMSYGSISQEAHEAIAIAMNRIGGKSNTGEGGEDVSRFKPLPNGDSKCSAIKQVASGRFGVTSEYLVNAQEIQIKMAQGAKPGEGGQLPGRKVYPWVAHTRHSTPGVGLISPPPHHDIYSIEDLAELIHDLKNANENARINVKLVSEVGVGTIAAGVAKGRADVILISGYDGGTGASPRTSIRHAGLPWELGLAEAHQTLLLNNLRSRVIVETDGKLMTGRDVVIAALLGAEEYGFATAPLVVLGCVMMRVCNLDTCPVGVATQNPELRKKFKGDPQHLVNFMHFIAQEMREIMAQLGFRTINEMIGRSDMLEMANAVDHWKAKGVDYSAILYQPEVPADYGRYCQISQDHELDKSLDKKVLLDLCKPAIEKGEKVNASVPIKNINRVVGTIVGSEVTRKYGGSGLPEDTITLNFKGSAGQSFGAFVPKGMTMILEGDSNDYIGKGLSGGKLIVYPPKESTFVPEENIIIGNVAFYGATSGEAYIRGVAGERFCVRNSGVHAVVEGVGDHGCEYMTGGRVVILGQTGRNFAAGMSGGVAYVYDTDGDFESKRCNKEMVELQPVVDTEDIIELKTMIQKHVEYTGSTHAKNILDDWNNSLSKFVKVIPKDYKRMISAIKKAQQSGLTGDEALMSAFEANFRDTARIGGN